MSTPPGQPSSSSDSTPTSISDQPLPDRIRAYREDHGRNFAREIAYGILDAAVACALGTHEAARTMPADERAAVLAAALDRLARTHAELEDGLTS